MNDIVLSKFVACELPTEVHDMFFEITSELGGAEYKPILYIGARSTETGINQIVLCETTRYDSEDKRNLDMIEIKKESGSKVSLVSIQTIA